MPAYGGHHPGEYLHALFSLQAWDAFGPGEAVGFLWKDVAAAAFTYGRLGAGDDEVSRWRK
jgi:hypothetical protein